MAVKKFKKHSVVVIYSHNFKDSSFTAVTRDPKFSTRYVKGIPFFSRRYMKGLGTFSVKNGILKGKGLDLGTEPPCIKFFC